jgi:AraC-like DNA-binding protein
MEGVDYSIAQLDRPFCQAGISGPQTLCYLVRKGTVWLEVAGKPTRVVELAAGTVVGTSGLVAHWLKSDPRASTRGAQQLAHEPLRQGVCGGRGIEILIGHAPLESLAFTTGTQGPGPIVVKPDSSNPISRRIWMAMSQIEEELTDPNPMGGVAASVRRHSELILLNIARYFFAQSARDELDTLETRLDIRILRATAVAAHGPLADWTVDKLANVAAMSRTTFYERFRALTGQSPLQTITQMRLRLAASELARGKRLVSEIADEAGYASSEAFTRAFSRYFGDTPARWRATHGS